MSKILKTTLTKYCFYVNDKKDAAAYSALCDTLKSKGLKCFESHGGGLHHGIKLNGDIELETSHLFNNQWNTPAADGKNGFRVMEWAQDYNPHGNRFIKQGYWIEPTKEMREAQDSTCACGYCGHQEPAQMGNVFCPKCIGSEYLTKETLHLLRMQPVSCTKNRAELSQAESEHLLPLFIAAKIHGTSERDKVRISKARENIEKTFLKVTKNAKIEHDGLLWLMDNGVSLNNVIFYAHTGKFCFGWRNPVTVEKDDLLAALSGFPFDYEIK